MYLIQLALSSNKKSSNIFRSYVFRLTTAHVLIGFSKVNYDPMVSHCKLALKSQNFDSQHSITIIVYLNIYSMTILENSTQVY